METPPLLKSRKFWIMVADAVFSLGGYFLTKYAAPAIADDWLKIMATLQPVVLFVIASITVQNVAGIKAKQAVDEARLYAAASPDDMSQ